MNEMSHFVMGVSDDLVAEFHATMLHDSMDISHLLMHAQQVEEINLKKKTRDSKKARSYDGGASKGNLRFKISQGLKKGFLTKFVPIYQG